MFDETVTRSRESSALNLNVEDVARLITANLVLLVYCFFDCTFRSIGGALREFHIEFENVAQLITAKAFTTENILWKVFAKICVYN